MTASKKLQSKWSDAVFLKRDTGRYDRLFDVGFSVPHVGMGDVIALILVARRKGRTGRMNDKELAWDFR